MIRGLFETNRQLIVVVIVIIVVIIITTGLSQTQVFDLLVRLRVKLDNKSNQILVSDEKEVPA